MTPRPAPAFTGRHMLATMLGFFGLVIAVNVTMASYATSTFGGEVVANSYVASQRYNGWLAAARAQSRLGWRVVPGVDAGGRLSLRATDAAGAALPATVVVTARHPLGRVPDIAVAMHGVGNGRLVGDRPLPAGRWLLHIDVRAAGHAARFEDEVQA